VLLNGGAVNEGIEVLEHARDTTPSSYALAFNLGSAYVMGGDAAKALEAYDNAVALEPGSAQALEQAAALAERQGELERSLSYWVRIRKLKPDDPATLFGFGRVC
jgi:tetratricopeptide (TPR) repeat protein